MTNQGRIRAYYRGARDGIRLYAHWEDGIQHVGTTGTTLDKALEELNEKEKAQLEMDDRIGASFVTPQL